jgi:Leucine-rich repeat (LRR) protein
LLEFTGEACLEDITQLMLREFGLDTFESCKSPELERFEALERLSLSHNHLPDLSGVSLCTSLQDLSINNNAVRDIHPLSQLLELRRLC